MSDRKRVTIRDVAKDTGLALSTVSNALAGKHYVSQETRELVNESVARLGYRASVVARSLRMQRSFTVGVLISDVANPSSADFVRGVEDVASREDCTVLLCNTDGDENRQIAHMRTLIDRQVDGIVMISQHCASSEVRALLDQAPPFVLVQRRNEAVLEDYVGSDNVLGVGEAIQHVYGLGHRRVGFLRGPADSSSARERLATFHAQASELGLELDPALIFPGDYSFDSGIGAARYFLALGERPTCILASSDMAAIGVLQVALDAGLRVPEDLSIVGLDDIAIASVRSINLTTIQLQKRTIGQAAAELLMRRIASPGCEPSQIILPTQLVVRGSTAAPPGARKRTGKTGRTKSPKADD
jgi:LacI family transcriptional regulator